MDGTAPASSSDPPPTAGPDEAGPDEAQPEEAGPDDADRHEAPSAPGSPDGPAALRRPGARWRAVAGSLTLAYVVWYAVDLTTLAVDPFLFNRVHAVADNLVTRLVLAVLFGGVLVHATDGLQRAVVDLWPRWERHAVGLRAAGGFVTMAVWVPAALIIVWPSIRWWWVR
jgi:succinate dehydrogenase/fumarate reductase cytochrome b subunit